MEKKKTTIVQLRFRCCNSWNECILALRKDYQFVGYISFACNEMQMQFKEFFTISEYEEFINSFLIPIDEQKKVERVKMIKLWLLDITKAMEEYRVDGCISTKPKTLLDFVDDKLKEKSWYTMLNSINPEISVDKLWIQYITTLIFLDENDGCLSITASAFNSLEECKTGTAYIKQYYKKQRKSCNHCKEPSTQFCSYCRQVYYCSVKCQRENWCTHKKICKKLFH